jgi:hypothetical protein
MNLNEQIHRDLRKYLRQKLKRAVDDHIDICETMELGAANIAAGLADTLLQLVVGYFIFLELTPQEFGQLCHDSFKEFQDRRQAKDED